MSDERVDQAMHMAVIAAGPIGNNERDWQRRVATAIPACASLLKEGASATARMVLDSSSFRAEYVGHELEESSSRLIVSFRSDTTDAKDADADGVETMRSEPMWTQAGRAMRRKIEALQPGDSVVAHKFVEDVDRGKKVRVLVHLEVLGRKRQVSQPTPSRRVEAPNEPPPEDRREPAGESDVRTTRFDALDNKTKVAFMKACRNYDPPIPDPFHDDDRLDAVLVLLGKAEKGEL